MTGTSSAPKFGSREQHFRIPGPRDGLPLFLRLLAATRDGAKPRRAVIYVHGATFPSALSIAHRFDGRSWRDALCAAGFDVWALDFYGFGGSGRFRRWTGPRRTIRRCVLPRMPGSNWKPRSGSFLAVRTSRRYR
jgi:pimeloyl-ACP methyl ester carboxylesterase